MSIFSAPKICWVGSQGRDLKDADGYRSYPRLTVPAFDPEIQQVDPPSGSAIYTVGVLESRVGGSTFWVLPGLLKQCT